MRIVFLGTNGWYDTRTGNTLSILVETKTCYILLDAGSGIYKLDQHIRETKPVYLFLSHFHLDHIIGLHTISKFNFAAGLKIFGPSGIKEILKNFINHPFTVPLEKLSYKAEIYDLMSEETLLPFKMRALPLRHSSECLGFRFEIENKIITFCTDTGYCDNAVNLARDADLFIAECSIRIEDPVDKNWPHLNPRWAAQIALEAKAKKLFLVHFDAACYETLPERQKAVEDAQKFFCNTSAAMDNMEVTIG